MNGATIISAQIYIVAFNGLFKPLHPLLLTCWLTVA